MLAKNIVTKSSLIFQYFQKKDQLTVKNREYQQTISSFFHWLVDNDKVNNDITTRYFPNLSSRAIIIAKQDGIIAGIEEVAFLLEKFTKLMFKPLFKDSSHFKNGDVIAEIKGISSEILAYERTILNILQRMSGIATDTHRLVTLIHPRPYTLDPKPYLSATRKTPWMGLDKKAVAIGGGLTHRLNLSDGILIKDNHLKIISKAIKTPRGWQAEAIAKAMTPPMVKEAGKLIEIEVTNEKQAHSAIKTFQRLITTNYPASPAGGQPPTTNYLAILLDNFTPSRAKSLLSDLRNLNDLSEIIFEASGGIDENNILEWSQTGVDILSLGSLTHSVKTANLSLELVTK